MHRQWVTEATALGQSLKACLGDSGVEVSIRPYRKSPRETGMGRSSLGQISTWHSGAGGGFDDCRAKRLGLTLPVYHQDSSRQIAPIQGG